MRASFCHRRRVTLWISDIITPGPSICGRNLSLYNVNEPITPRLSLSVHTPTGTLSSLHFYLCLRAASCPESQLHG